MFFRRYLFCSFKKFTSNSSSIASLALTSLVFFPLIFFSLILLSFQAFSLPSSQQNYSILEAHKVLQAIEKVQSESLLAPGDRLREVIITESELNSYIGYRIETEKDEIMKELRLKIFDGNNLEGKIHIDLRGQKIPSFIRPEMNFYFSAILEVANAKARLNIKELFLEGQPIQPFLLDLVIQIMARIDNTEATSLTDWYDLPYGIKDIKTKKGLAVFYY